MKLCIYPVCIHIMEYFSAIRKDKIIQLDTTLRELGNVVFIENKSDKLSHLYVETKQ